MNINLSSVSESPKVTNVAPEGGEATTETSESGGFFAKLAALITGDSSKEVSDAPASDEKGQTDLEVAAGGETGSAKVSVEENQSTEALLEQGDGEDAEDGKPTQAAKDSPPDESSAAKIVSDSDQVLQRLDESNRALKTQDGKELPPKSNRDTVQTEVDGPNGKAMSSTGDEEISLASHEQNAKTPLHSQSTVDAKSVDSEEPALKGKQVDAENGVKSSDVEQETVAIPASAQRFIQPSTEAKDGEKTENGEESLDAKAALSAALVAKGQDNKVDDKVVIEPKQASLKPVAEQSDIANEEPVKVSQVTETELGNELDSDVLAATLAPSAVVSAGVTAAAISEAPQKLNPLAPELVTTAIVDDGSEKESTSELAAATMASAIPWASTEQVVSDEIKLKPELHAKAQQAPVAQSVHQAIVNQQSQVAQQALQANSHQAVPMPNDLAASQLQQLAAAPNVAVNQDQALLKAALGAKAAASVGKLATGGKGGTQSSGESGSGFAHQLAQAAGQPGSSAMTQARAEQVAQAPLQLNREFAGEQVAERVQMMMSKNLKNIDIRLDPPELGRMQIRMNMNGDAATVHFTVANQQARDVIEQSMPRLREMLAQQGVQLGDSSVQQQASGQQQRRYADGGQGQSGQGGSGQSFQGEENLEPDINLDLNVAAKRDGISYYA
ncbi:flagellar hook-length control protein FliK [Vibrio sp. JPW-9-11-11]|uniref:flagellar hook-length control protein FliK n=1 Tax=Vibrio sp. JPW-9-11-11 TaxID=1416532 RepID=UPI0015936E38|nr:flagellar hook-length control protein FliK [Vibrio sp. JPW-9-11-11]NVD06137.1 flagellar hook-length control protein FliK [Vibrio sp. JPW-9-11-11]